MCAAHVQAPDPPHILLIDDEPEALRALVTLIRQQGWQVSLAAEPHRGHLRALALQPDLIVLDVSMPGMDGMALLRRLRAAPETQDIPVIFLSAQHEADQRLAGLTQGGVDYVTKPFEPQEVLARIRIHMQLARRGKQQQAPAPRAVQASTPSPEVSSPTDADEALLRAAMRFIEAHLADLPGLTEIASAVGTHEKRLSQVFRQRAGSTVFAFARQLRLQKAKDLLVNSNLEIQDIAELTGYQSAANFATAFREQQSMTPSDYRQQARGKGKSE
ncbi:response regulator [Hylemonella gracilis]|jgi:DNA-binding response OmpR family regulator|uniref:Response regulator n=1 Tax=Hylemonella gracilis TaxID=80880 RepID=A0A4P6UNU7_9BURK|nr:DNA-binding response regulator [Hylemonella gracilis]QBK05785.1 response regulator [Hylemonella gracilis]